MKIRVKSMVGFLVFTGIVFQSILSIRVPAFDYFDEILSLVVFLAGMRCLLLGGRVDRLDLLFLGCIGGFYLAGWLSYGLHRYQSLLVTFQSSLLSVKFFLLFIGTKLCCEAGLGGWFREESLCRMARVQMFLLALYAFVSGRVESLPEFLPFILCAQSVFLIAVLLLNPRKRLPDKLGILLGLCLLFSSGKAKAYGSIVLLLAVAWWVIRGRRRFRLWHFAAAGAMLLAAAWDKIYFYYILGYGRFARSLMTLTSLRVGRDLFPLGGGWGTFGSYYSAVCYSPLYYQYGLASHYEVGVVNRWFIMDAYWPSVLGETGWLGMAFVGLLLLLIFRKIQETAARDRYRYGAGLYVFLYLLITTFEESGFMQPALLCLAMVLGVVLARRRETAPAAKRERIAAGKEGRPRYEDCVCEPTCEWIFPAGHRQAPHP